MNAAARPPQATMRNRAILLAILAGLAFAVLIGLGTWQVKRLAWKEGLIATIHERIAAPPVTIDDIVDTVSTGEEIEYRPMTATGTFAHDREQYFLATYQGASGWYVYTPLRTEGGSWLFVNRGFVPYDRRDPGTRAEGQVEGVVAVSGLARSAPEAKPSAIVPENDPQRRTYYWKDIEAMRTAAGLESVLPFFLDAGAAPNPGGLPIGGVTIVELPNNHLQYAVTWYGLALALAAVAGAWLLRGGRG